MPKPAISLSEQKRIRARRKHAILTSRLIQLERNLKAMAGGGPYIEDRLSRFPSESDRSWDGSSDGAIKPRKDRAFLINYAGRICSKIIQHVFSQGISRDGIGEEFSMDATKTKHTIDALMKDAGRYFIAGQWCWLQIDRGSPGLDPATGKPRIRSMAEREQAGDRIFWSLWRPNEVVDWRFDNNGNLKWLITQETLYDNDNIDLEATTRVVRSIYEGSAGERLIMKPGTANDVETVEPISHSAGQPPFVLIGTPSTDPHWYDDIERIQASMLNLESAHHEALIQAHFPQIVIPSSLIKEIMALSGRTFEESLEMVRGIDYPIFEPTDANGLTRFIMPPHSEMKSIPEELDRRRRELFEIVGQAMRSSGESKQVESAQAKAWDHKDVEASLADHAEVLEDAERKAIQISKRMDTAFSEYTPQYPRSFDLPELENDWKIVMEMENSGNLPDTVKKQIARTKVEILDRIYHFAPELKQQAIDEIEDMEFEDIIAMTAPFDRSQEEPDPNADDEEDQP